MARPIDEALKIRSEIEKIFEYPEDLIIEVFSNGYEQGIVFKVKNEHGGLQCNVALSKIKNPNSTYVVYFGKEKWFDWKTNCPRLSKDWLRRVFFSQKKDVIEFVDKFISGKKNVRTGLSLESDL